MSRKAFALRPARAAVASGLAALLATLLIAPGSLAAAPRVHPAELTPSGNFFLAVPGPHGFADPGSRLTVQYRVQAPLYPDSAGPGTIHVPATIASFTTSTGGNVHLFVPANGFTVVGKSVSSIANASLRLTTGESFSTSNTTLSSNNFAVQASWNPGQYSVQIQWQWVVVLADGTQTAGAWSSWTSVSPAQIANLSGTPPGSVTVGGNFPICMTGPIANREFSVHFSTSAPITTFSGPTVTVPAGNSGVYCWNSTLPTSWAPQTIEAHIWELASANYLLYQMPFQLVNGTGGNHPPPPPGGGAPWYSGLTTPVLFGWLSPLLLLILGLVVIVGFAALAARRRSRKARAARAAAASNEAGSTAAGDDSSRDGPPGFTGRSG